MPSARSRCRILAIDDSVADRALLRRALLKHDVDLLGFPNGIEGIEAAHHYAQVGQPPDAVLLDLALTGMTGLDVLTILKGHPLTAAIPVVIVTGTDDAQTRATMLEAGAAAYIVKPYNAEQLAQEVLAACGI